MVDLPDFTGWTKEQVESYKRRHYPVAWEVNEWCKGMAKRLPWIIFFAVILTISYRG